MRSVDDVSELELLRRRVDEASDPYAASELGWLLWRRWDSPDARETDLEECVEAFALAMVLNIGTFPEQLLPRIADAAAPFAAGLLERGATTADPRPVNLAVELWNRIASVLPDHAGHLSRLGVGLRMQFDRTGDAERLALAVRAGETALVRADPDDPELPAMLHDVAVTLTTTYVHGGERAELLRAVALLEEAVTVLPQDHPRRATYLSSLAAARRLRHDGDSDLRSAVRLARRAVEIGPTGDAALLSGLATALLTSFRSTGLAADLDEAVDIAGAAVAALPAGHPDAPTALADQAAALRTKFDTSGDAADLDGAIRAAGAALTAASRTEPDKAMFRATLGTALLTRYERTGRTADLAKAVRLLQDAVDATPPVHAERAVRLSHLGLALEAQARRSGDRAQLDAAVRSLRAACATAVDDPLLPMFLSNLSNVLHTRFDVVGSSTDLTEAVDALTDAVTATPSSHPDLPLYLGNLAGARLTRFQHRDQPAGPEEPTDLDAAVEAGHRALDLTPADHPSRPIRQTNLGTALRTRGTCEPGGGRDLDEAVELCTAAVAGQPETDPEHPAMLSNLASSLLTRYRHGQLGGVVGLIDRDEAGRRAQSGEERGQAEDPISAAGAVRNEHDGDRQSHVGDRDDRRGAERATGSPGAGDPPLVAEVRHLLAEPTPPDATRCGIRIVQRPRRAAGHPAVRAQRWGCDRRRGLGRPRRRTRHHRPLPARRAAAQSPEFDVSADPDGTVRLIVAVTRCVDEVGDVIEPGAARQPWRAANPQFTA